MIQTLYRSLFARLALRAIAPSLAFVLIVFSDRPTQGAPGDLDETTLVRVERVFSWLLQIAELEQDSLRQAVTAQWRVTPAEEKRRFLPNLVSLERLLSSPDAQGRENARRQMAANFLQAARDEPDKPLHRFVLSLPTTASRPPAPQPNQMRAGSQSAASVSTGRSVPGALEGLYVGAWARPRIGAIGTDIVPDYLVFSRDGRFFNGEPRIKENGDIDLARSAQEAPQLAGTYRVQGGTILLMFPARSGKEYPWDLVKRRGEIVVRKQGFDFYPRRPVSDLRLVGKYRYGFAQTSISGASSQTAQTIHEKSIAFTKDGRFTMTSFAATTLAEQSTRSGQTRVQGGAYNSSAPKTGRYRINNYAIDFAFDDGTSTRSPFMLPDDSLRTVNIGGTAFYAD